MPRYQGTPRKQKQHHALNNFFDHDNISTLNDGNRSIQNHVCGIYPRAFIDTRLAYTSLTLPGVSVSAFFYLEVSLSAKEE